MWKLPELASEEDLTDKPLIVLLVLASILQTTTTYSAEKPPHLANHDVLTLLDHGLPERMVLRAIEAAENNFDISNNAILALKKDGVSNEVVNAMVRSTLHQNRS